jgi:hypothetical protein
MLMPILGPGPLPLHFSISPSWFSIFFISAEKPVRDIFSSKIKRETKKNPSKMSRKRNAQPRNMAMSLRSVCMREVVMV